MQITKKAEHRNIPFPSVLDKTLECVYGQQKTIFELNHKMREAKEEMDYLKREAIKEIIKADEIDLLTINMTKVRRRQR